MKFFEKYLSVWVIICMIFGVIIGKIFPNINALLSGFEIANISLIMAVLMWVMIYPMMIKVNFLALKNAIKSPKGLYLTWIVNWLIKPFTMFLIAWLFFRVIFGGFFDADLASGYLSGAFC